MRMSNDMNDELKNKIDMNNRIIVNANKTKNLIMHQKECLNNDEKHIQTLLANKDFKDGVNLFNKRNFYNNLSFILMVVIGLITLFLVASGLSIFSLGFSNLRMLSVIVCSLIAFTATIASYKSIGKYLSYDKLYSDYNDKIFALSSNGVISYRKIVDRNFVNEVLQSVISKIETMDIELENQQKMILEAEIANKELMKLYSNLIKTNELMGLTMDNSFTEKLTSSDEVTNMSKKCCYEDIEMLSNHKETDINKGKIFVKKIDNN